MSIEKKNARRALIISLAAVVYYVIFSVVPLFMLIFYSFTDYNVLERTQNFIGIKNFITIFAEKEYLLAFGSSLLIAVLTMGFQILFGFFIALGLNAVKKGKTFLSVLWYLPTLLPMAVMSRFVSISLQPLGLVNKILIRLGTEPVVWQDSTFWMFFFIIALVVWKGLGSISILCLAGLGGINKEVYEAGEIDGATGLKKVFYITLPLMRPMFSFILITGFINAFNIFEPIQLISNGGPRGSTETLLVKIYNIGFQDFKLGLASALSFVTFIILMALTVLNMKVSDSDILKK